MLSFDRECIDVPNGGPSLVAMASDVVGVDMVRVSRLDVKEVRMYEGGGRADCADVDVCSDGCQ